MQYKYHYLLPEDDMHCSLEYYHIYIGSMYKEGKTNNVPLEATTMFCE